MNTEELFSRIINGSFPELNTNTTTLIEKCFLEVILEHT